MSQVSSYGFECLGIDSSNSSKTNLKPITLPFLAYHSVSFKICIVQRALVHIVGLVLNL